MGAAYEVRVGDVVQESGVGRSRVAVVQGLGTPSSRPLAAVGAAGDWVVT